MPIVGRERSGKTNLALYCCQTIDKEFGAHHVFYSTDVFLDNLESIPKGSAILIDEGAELMFNRDWQNVANRNLIRVLMACGFKNLFIAFVMPVFEAMDKYIRMHRASSLLITEFDYNNETKAPLRGWFRSYGAEKLLRIRIKHGRTIWPRPDFAEYCPHVASVYPELWKNYQELEEPRKIKLIAKAKERIDIGMGRIKKKKGPAREDIPGINEPIIGGTRYVEVEI